ncbi:MAG TPA: sulfurtransferase TusA family protein [Vicinamibacterales bacterium]|nr:sulfurtransferase TusA family protein [Vicinamibacterales bacterium]
MADAPPSAGPQPADAVIDAAGLSCGQLEPLIARSLRTLSPGQVLEIRSDRPEARDGIAAWVWLTGHTLVAVSQDEAAGTRYYVRKNAK